MFPWYGAAYTPYRDGHLDLSARRTPPPLVRSLILLLTWVLIKDAHGTYRSRLCICLRMQEEYCSTTVGRGNPRQREEEDGPGGMRNLINPKLCRCDKCSRPAAAPSVRSTPVDIPCTPYSWLKRQSRWTVALSFEQFFVRDPPPCGCCYLWGGGMGADFSFCWPGYYY